MADDDPKFGGLSTGLAIVLNGKNSREGSGKAHLVASCNGFTEQSVERAIEHIFNLPYMKIKPLTCPVDSTYIRSMIRSEFLWQNLIGFNFPMAREGDGVSTGHDVSQSGYVKLDEPSIFGDIQIVKHPFVVETHASFSSVRANTCVWRGKWMYEVTLETSGVQQLGWATAACLFTDHMGVGDSDESYAYDGKRVRKWNKETEPYGQPWVAGDVIGCCIDLDSGEILFYRNGISLGLAFSGIRKMVPGLGYYPAISLSQGERCELNFGGIPFAYPIKGYLPIQSPPSTLSLATELIDCFRRLLQMWRPANVEIDTVETIIKLKRFELIEDLFSPISDAICEEFCSILSLTNGSAEYIGRGLFCSFIMGTFRSHPPHDYSTLDRIIDSFIKFPESRILFEHLLGALSAACKTSSLVLTECPYSGSYNYLAVACHILRRNDLMMLWWKSSDFEFMFEGFLSRKIPNEHDLRCLIPSVWWPGSCEDSSSEHSMLLTTAALSVAVNKIEEKQRELCHLVMQFVPPVTPPQFPGSVFRTFLQNILLKNRGADRNVPPPGVSSNSVLVSLFSVILHFLSEGFDIYGWNKRSGPESRAHLGLLHRGGEQCFPASLFLKNDPHRVDISRMGGSYSHLSKCYPVITDQQDEMIRWEEGFMDDEETKVTHLSRQKPCCCSTYDSDTLQKSKDHMRYSSKGRHGSGSSVPDRSSRVPRECSSSNLSEEIVEKPSTSHQPDTDFSFRPVQQIRILQTENTLPSAILNEEELVDAMLLLYHLGLAPKFKQVSSSMYRYSSSISLLEETDRHIREGISGDKAKRLKEARRVYREEVMDCVRHSAWYRLSLFSHWKQRGMYATCMWIVHLLLVASKLDSVFIYIPEYYLETLVDLFHVLRKSDPPFVAASIFIKQGLASFVTFVVTHFNDSRISSAELKDQLLQSIAVLLQYKEFLAAFECNKAATLQMPKALFAAFDNRSWIPVTNILLRLWKGSGYNFPKIGESSSSSVLFQKLLVEACTSDDQLFSIFLNRLFNTLSWAMTEFSISVREMQENYKLLDVQQRKCSVIFDLSCNLARVLEFCTRDIPQAFVSGSDMNLRRLAELIIFVLNHLIRSVDPEALDLSLRRPEKVNSGMILAPLAGIILNLLDANQVENDEHRNDIVWTFASMDCADTILIGFQYLLEYNSVGFNKGDDDSIVKLMKLEQFSNLLISRSEMEKSIHGVVERETDDGICCICYTNPATARITPCHHVSCYGCISRHLLNCQRCFFCNATVLDISQEGLKDGETGPSAAEEYE